MKYYFKKDVRDKEEEPIKVKQGVSWYILWMLLGGIGLCVIIGISIVNKQWKYVISYFVDVFALFLLFALIAGVTGWVGPALFIYLISILVMYILYIKNMNRWQMSILINNGYKVVENKDGIKLGNQEMKDKSKVKVPFYVFFK